MVRHAVADDAGADDDRARGGGEVAHRAILISAVDCIRKPLHVIETHPLATQIPSSLEIAQRAAMRPIREIAEDAGLLPDEIETYGRYKAKIDLSVLDRLADRPDGKLIDVTAITPTKAGEGKTTTSVVADAGARRDRHAGRCCACARRRSAPCSGSRAARPAAATRRSCRWRT